MALVLTRLVRSNYDELDNIPIIHQDLTKSFTKQADTYYIHTGSTTSAYIKGRMYYCDGTNLKKVVIVDELPKVNDGKLTITVNGTAHTFTANQSGNTSFSITDTGATSVEVTGTGNAVTAASYNASTRKLTLTKGATFLTSHQDISGKLDKTTYEWNKEFAAGSNGAISLGRYNIYDTQLTFDISSTTSISMNGKLVIATQNGRICQAKVFGDATGVLVSKIVIYQSAIVNNRSWIEVFCNFDGWSKNKVHIYGVALESATVTNQMSSVTFTNGVPSPITSGDSKWNDTIVNDLSEKQNKLTAGSNITISGNTISATDTGATSVGTSGTGNGLAGASYDSSTRKITFTMGKFLVNHQSIKKLNTNNTVSYDVNSNESITGEGIINLHKIAKTGLYNDLINKPSDATQSTAGLMSAADKEKLDGIATGATKNTFSYNSSTKVLTIS